eukprot:1221598-Alexandrium_andersonii.AAC.1
MARAARSLPFPGRPPCWESAAHRSQNGKTRARCAPCQAFARESARTTALLPEQSAGEPFPLKM